MTETVDEIDRVLMSADVEFLHGVPVHMNRAGAHAIRKALASAGYAIVKIVPMKPRPFEFPEDDAEPSPGYSEQRLDFYRVRDAFSPGYTERRAGLKAGKDVG